MGVGIYIADVLLSEGWSAYCPILSLASVLSAWLNSPEDQEMESMSKFGRTSLTFTTGIIFKIRISKC